MGPQTFLLSLLVNVAKVREAALRLEDLHLRIRMTKMFEKSAILVTTNLALEIYCPSSELEN